MKILKKYRIWLYGLADRPIRAAEEEALDSVWDRVEEELILDEAWTGIESGLGAGGINHSQDSPEENKMPLYRTGAFIISAAALIILVFLLLNTSKTENSGNTEPHSPAVIPPNVDSVENREKITSPIPDNQPFDKPGKEPVDHSEKNIIPRQIANESIRPVINDEEKEEHTITPEVLSYYSLEQDDIISPDRAMNVEESGKIFRKERGERFTLYPLDPFPGSSHPHFLPHLELEASLLPEKFPPAWRVYGAGISISYNNSWIINDETVAGLRPSSLTDTRFSYAPEIGLSTVLASGKGQRIELEFFVISDQSQRYNQYINALYQERKISLRYQKIHVSWLVPLRIIPLRAGIGGYYSILNRAEETVSGEIRSVSNLYTRNDFGLTFQIAQEYTFFSRFVFVPSVRFQYSLHNIFEGNDIIPGSFRNTRNASAGINLGIHYRF